MRFKIDGYEVEINAKKVGRKKTSKKETFELVNYLACVFIDARNYNTEHDNPAIADRCRWDLASMFKAMELIEQGD